MALQTKNVIFTAEKTDLQGYLAWNEDQDGSRPAVLVFPEWWGLNNYIKKRTEQVASLWRWESTCMVTEKQLTIPKKREAS